jgi:dihydroorotase
MLELRRVWLPNLFPDETVTIRLSQGMIAEICLDTGWEPHIDCQGCMALPGLIDGHVHDRDPGDPEAEDALTVQRAALLGGVTTIGKMPNTDPPLTTVDEVVRRARRDKGSKVHCGYWLGATKNNWREIARPRVIPEWLGVKLYMAPTTGGLVIPHRQDQKIICAAAREHGDKLVVSHSEKASRIALNRQRFLKPNVCDHCLIRDTQCEVEAVAEILEIGYETDCRLHIAHVSTPEAARLIVTAQRRGVRVTFEFCPHLVMFTREELRGERGPLFKTNPPLRSPDQVQELQAYLLDECLDIVTIGTDHAPHGLRKKQERDCDLIPSGAPGLDTLAPVFLEWVYQGRLSLRRFIQLTAETPARVFGYTTKGRLQAGFDADLIVVNPQQEVHLRNSAVGTKCGWTLHHGRTVHGAVKLVVVGGRAMLNRFRR